MALSTKLMKNATWILNLAGSLFTPFLSGFGPVMLLYTYNKSRNVAMTSWFYIFNFGFIVPIWVLFGYFGLTTVFK
jgi:hypothetical protein